MRDERPLTSLESALEAAARLCCEAPQLNKLLVLGVRRDGTSFSCDNGLTADEAKTMMVHFETWLDACLERQRETEQNLRDTERPN